jgi:hypothetical protein
MNNNFGAEVVLVGANNSELSKFKLIQKSLEIKDRFLKVYPHVIHTEVIKLLHIIDVLILPIPRSDNYVGMPIKLLEYTATGKIVIVADCSLFRSFFNKITPHSIINQKMWHHYIAKLTKLNLMIIYFLNY